MNSAYSSFRWLLVLLMCIGLGTPIFGQDAAELVAAVEKGDLAKAKACLAAGVKAATLRSRDSLPVLSIALQNGDRAMSRCLIEAGAPLFAWGQGSPTPVLCGDSAMCQWFQGFRDAAQALWDAGSEDDLAPYQKIAAAGYPMDLKARYSSQRPIARATEKGDLKLVQELVRLGAKPLAPPSAPREAPLLHIAANRGHLELTRYLLSQGITVNATFVDGLSPLHSALFNKRHDVAMLLIEAGADLKAVWQPDQTPLELAAEGQDRIVLDLLIAKGIRPMNDPEVHKDILAGLAGFGDVATYRHYVKALALDSLLPTRPDMQKIGNNPLAVAAKQPSLQFVQYLVDDLGYDVNGFGAGDYPLSAAAAEGHADIVMFLLERGATIERGDPVTAAVRRCKPAVVKILLEAGAEAKPNGDEFGPSPIKSACIFDCLEAAQLLVQYGADPQEGICQEGKNQATLAYLKEAARQPRNRFQAIRLRDYAALEGLWQGNEGAPGPQEQRELLSIAIDSCDAEGIRTLLKLGCDLEARDNRGRSLLHHAYAQGPKNRRPCRLSTLLQFHPQLDAADHEGITVLMWAVENGDLESVRALLDAGANPNLEDHFGFTPLLHIGFPWYNDSNPGFYPVVKLLIARGANPKATADDGTNLLIAACQRNDLALARYALDSLHIPLNKTKTNGTSAFTQAVSAPWFEYSRVIEPRYEAYHRDYDSWHANVNDSDWVVPRVALIQYLLSKGANVKALNEEAITDPVALIYQGGFPDLAKKCVEAGYPVNRNSYPLNLLNAAVEANDHAFVKYLLDLGADPKMKVLGTPLNESVTDPDMKKLLNRR